MGLIEEIWKNKKANVVKPRAFSDVAQKKATKISEDGGGPRGRKNQSSQLRKYYDVIFNLNQMSKVPGTSWNSILARLHRQVALVHYAKGRNLVTGEFVSMMDELIKSVERPEDLQVVTDFLEAFMAYYKECRPKN